MRNDLTIGFRLGAIAIAITAAVFATTRAQAQSKADECQSRPGAATRGMHWYYRIERPSGRRCWFLAAERGRETTAAERPEPRSAATARGGAARNERTDEPPAQRPTRARTALPSERLPVPATTAADDRLDDAQQVEPAPAPALQGSSVPVGVPQAAMSDVAHPGQRPLAAGWDSAARATMPDARPVIADEIELPPTAAVPRAAMAVPAEPAPSIGQLLLFFAAAAAFVCIAFRAALNLSAHFVERRQRRPQMRPVPAVAGTADLRTILARASRADRPPAVYEPTLAPDDNRWSSIERALRHGAGNQEAAIETRPAARRRAQAA